MGEFFDNIEIKLDDEAANEGQEGNSDGTDDGGNSGEGQEDGTEGNADNEKQSGNDQEDGGSGGGEGTEGLEGKGQEAEGGEGSNPELKAAEAEISTLESELQERTEQIETIQIEFQAIQGLVQDGQKEGGDPLAPLFHLVGLAGGDVNAYVDAINGLIKNEVTNVVESMEKYGDNGPEIHFKELALKQKTSIAELGTKIKERMAEGHKANQDFRTALKEQNISMRQFNAARKEMAEFGHENLSNAQIMEYAQLMPHMDRSEQILEEHLDTEALSTDQRNEVASMMAKLSLQRPELEDMEIIEMAAKMAGLKTEEDAENKDGQIDHSDKDGKTGQGKKKNLQGNDSPAGDDSVIIGESDSDSIWTMSLH